MFSIWHEQTRGGYIRPCLKFKWGIMILDITRINQSQWGTSRRLDTAQVWLKDCVGGKF